MGVVVFDSDVLIGFLRADDAHHEAATRIVREATTSGATRQVSAVNYAEILVGPERLSTREVVDDSLARLSIDVMHVDAELASSAAGVRGQTGLKLPDAFALATALRAQRRGGEVRLATFDRAVRSAASKLLAA